MDPCLQVQFCSSTVAVGPCGPCSETFRGHQANLGAQHRLVDWSQGPGSSAQILVQSMAWLQHPGRHGKQECSRRIFSAQSAILPGNAILQQDLGKFFDSINGDHLRLVLEHLGAPQDFVRLVDSFLKNHRRVFCASGLYGCDNERPGAGLSALANPGDDDPSLLDLGVRKDRRPVLSLC